MKVDYEEDTVMTRCDRLRSMEVKLKKIKI